MLGNKISFITKRMINGRLTILSRHSREVYLDVEKLWNQVHFLKTVQEFVNSS